MKHLHAQRGQTIPVWAFGTLTVLTMLAFALSYGNMLRWQIRSQNAADAAARGILSIQATQWNEMESDLHASAVEEYRIRSIAQAMLLTIRGNGGCNVHSDVHDDKSCRAMYFNLRAQYANAVTRYANDVTLLQRITNPSFDDQVTAAKAALAAYQQNCGQTNGGDCGFAYTLTAAKPRVDQYLADVRADCCGFVVGGGTNAPASLAKNLSPMQIEVVACANVPTLLPAFFKFTAPTYTAIGRAAATTVMSTQEFMYVGTINNPLTGKPFQQVEYPASEDGQGDGNGNGNGNKGDGSWYDVDYGGNAAVSDGKFGFYYTPENQGLLAAMGWWSSIPERPFAGQLQLGGSVKCN
ncbi:MAG: Tad domain-containing protein [Candidatus Eremiobacteraeota bacterium]|nr:Tad domain-containing protein [Candidatus Eremiobacteraeota bacterium]